MKDYGYYDEDHPEAGGTETFQVKDMDDLLHTLSKTDPSDVKKMVDNTK